MSNHVCNCCGHNLGLHGHAGCGVPGCKCGNSHSGKPHQTLNDELTALRSETARLTAELARVEKERDEARSETEEVHEMWTDMVCGLATEGGKMIDCSPGETTRETIGNIVGKVEQQIVDQLTAALTRAKSAEDRATAMSDVKDKAEHLMHVMAQWRQGGYRVEGCQIAERQLRDAIAAITPPVGDAGKGGA